MNPLRASLGFFRTVTISRVVCFLVFISLLYNPFVVAYGMGNGLLVCHPPSLRATNASAELLKFSSPKPVDLSSDCLPCSETRLRVPQPAQSVLAHIQTDCVLPLPLDSFDASLYFRPPPAV